MSSSQSLQLNSPTNSNGKSIKTFLKTVTNPTSPKASNNLTAQLYINKFNADLQKIQENGYKSKNSHLFTWNQTIYHQSKLKLPPPYLGPHTNMTSKDASETIPSPDNSSYGSPTYTQLDSIKAIENAFDPVVKSRQQGLQENHKNFYATQGGFKHLEKNKLNHRKAESLSISYREKKPYSVVKLQMSLLKNKNPSLINDIPNGQFMSNQFDRRNFNFNKIISQIHIHNDMLDKQEIKDETIRKLKHVSGDMKLHKELKPKTASHRLTGTKILITPSPKANEGNKVPGYRKDRKSMVDIMSKSPRSKNFKSSKEVQEAEIFILKKGDRPSIFGVSKGGEEPLLKFRNKTELNQLMQKFQNVSEAKKANKKAFYETIDAGLREIDFKERNTSKNQQFDNEPKSPQTLIKIQPKQGSNGGSNGPKGKNFEEIKENNFLSSLTPIDLDENNILNFGKYFKHRYLEKSSGFEMSKDLKSKVHTFGRDIEEAFNSIGALELLTKRELTKR